MNTLRHRITVGILQGCLVAAPLFVLSVEPAAAKQPAVCKAARSGTLDARLAAKADAGSASLRRFVARTGTIYGLDMPTARARAARFHRAREACDAVES